MIYHKLEIKNFRGIKKLEIEDLSRVNLFMGKNNSGKSSILEAIFLLTGQYNPQLIINIDTFRNLAHNEEDDFRFVFYNLNFENVPIVRAELGDGKSFRQIRIYPKKNTSESGSNFVSQYKILPGDDLIDTAISERVFGLTIDSISKNIGKQQLNLKNSITIERNQNREAFFNIISDKRSVTDFRALFQHSNTGYTNDLVKRLERMLIDKESSEIIDSLKLLDKRIKSIHLGSNSMIYFDIGAMKLMPAHLMGDGVRKLLFIIANLNETKNGMLLIDEIDNGMHFKSLGLLWKIIFKTAREKNVQLFITTHSREAFQNMCKVLNEREYIEYQDDIRCFTVSRSQDDEAFAFKYNFNDLMYAIEQDIEIRGDF